MHFDSGKFGAVVVVVALVLTIFVGYCTDFTKVQRETTDYEYVTDITGLFETEQVPEYTLYNPNSNYVGYSGPVEYTPARQPNNYRYMIEGGTTTTDSDILQSNEIRAYPSGMADFTFIYLNYTGSTYSFTPQFTSTDGGSWNISTFANQGGDLPIACLSTFYTILNNAELNLSSVETLEIDISYTGTGGYPVFVLPSLESFNKLTLAGGTQQWTANVTDANIPDRAVVNVSTMFITLYRGDSMLFSGPSDSIPVIYSYNANDYTGSTVNDRAPVTMRMDFTLTGFATYGYADPQSGVSIPWTDQWTTWDNGYTVEEITVLFSNPNIQQQRSIYVSFYETDRSAWDVTGNIWISIGSGETIVRAYDDRISGGDITFGSGWNGIEVTFNRTTGIITATPTDRVWDFTTGPSIRGETQQVTTGWSVTETPPANVDFRLRGSDSAGGPMKLGVFSTLVDLDSYGVVMNDPTIDIKDYWPEIGEYRLNFYSFALVGDSVRINNVTYPVSDSQTITVTDAETQDSYTKTLTNIYVSTKAVDGTEHTFLTFVNDNLTVDLGETVNDTISFDGLWYFTTALYEGFTTTISDYEWNVDGTFDATIEQFVLVFVALLGVGVVLGKSVLKLEPTFLDYGIIVVAGIIGLAIWGL